MVREDGAKYHMLYIQRDNQLTREDEDTHDGRREEDRATPAEMRDIE